MATEYQSESAYGESTEEKLQNKKPFHDGSSNSGEDIPTAVPEVEPKLVDHEKDSEEEVAESDSEDLKLKDVEIPDIPDSNLEGSFSESISKPTLVAKKRSRKENGSGTTNTKKSKTEEEKSPHPAAPVTKLWSEKEEIDLLKRILEFKDVKGLDPSADWGIFYNFIKENYVADFSKDQLRNKIKRMKKRFSNALKKGENGSDPVFELSKKIWSNNNSTEKVIDCELERVNWPNYPFLSLSFDCSARNFPSILITSEVGISLMKEKLSLIGNAKAKELDEKWKQLIAEEVEVNQKMMNLIKEQVKIAFDQ